MPGKKTKKQKIIDISIQLFRNSANISKISIEDIAGEEKRRFGYAGGLF